MFDENWALDGLDIDEAEAKVAEQLDKEASLPETDAGDGCEGGACKI